MGYRIPKSSHIRFIPVIYNSKVLLRNKQKTDISRGKRKKERKETSQSKTEWTKIYNAQNIVETEQLVEMLKQNGIVAFSQEAGANVAMHGAPGFGIYGVDIFVKTDDAEKAVQLIKEINNQE